MNFIKNDPSIHEQSLSILISYRAQVRFEWESTRDRTNGNIRTWPGQRNPIEKNTVFSMVVDIDT